MHIQMFCQSYESQVSLKIRDTVQKLQCEIGEMEKMMLENEEGINKSNEFSKKKLKLKHLLQEQVKNALIRSRFCSVKDMDAPSAFFFKLERNVVQHNPMLHLRRPDGTITHNPNEMRKLAVEFYSGLFNAEQCDDESVADICQDLPKLQPKQRETLDSDISLQELTDAVKQLSSGRSPGIDGITTDFYHYFWNVLGQDFYEVVKECFENGFLPSSCRRAVLSLLPKKGDLGLLKNWRPVSLLCTDYKILAKCLANRLKRYLDTIIHSDQTYCVPERSIMDNLFLLRDAVDLSFKENINMGFLSIDQEKAFDRVDHGYLFSALSSFGFGERFISWVKLLYRECFCTGEGGRRVECISPCKKRN